MIVSSLMVGAVFGALAAGPCCNRYGRKRTILCTSILFCVCGIGMGLAGSLKHLLLWRFTIGIAVGASGPSVSTYIAEIAKPHQRGQLVTVYEVYYG